MQTRFDQDSYREKLRSSLIGLSFFGVGFDTVRYWEIPANGGMLLAERPPICIPDNFEDGISAVFFENMSELESKLDYYLKHPDEAARIAANGYTHYLKYHTTTARARCFLDTVYQHLFHRPNGAIDVPH
jgi:spore maturation protein CgeB